MQVHSANGLYERAKVLHTAVPELPAGGGKGEREMSEIPVQTIVFEVNDKIDARELCEIFAMNGYMAKAKSDDDSITGGWLVFVEVGYPKHTQTAKSVYGNDSDDARVAELEENDAGWGTIAIALNKRIDRLDARMFGMERRFTKFLQLNQALDILDGE